jgi:hypothetical protein
MEFKYKDKMNSRMRRTPRSFISLTVVKLDPKHILWSHLFLVVVPVRRVVVDRKQARPPLPTMHGHISTAIYQVTVWDSPLVSKAKCITGDFGHRSPAAEDCPAGSSETFPVWRSLWQGAYIVRGVVVTVVDMEGMCWGNDEFVGRWPTSVIRGPKEVHVAMSKAGSRPVLELALFSKSCKPESDIVFTRLETSS